MLWGSGPLGAISLLASDCPPAIAWPAAVLVVGAAWRSARVESARAPMTLEWPAAGPPRLDGRPLARARLRWRGPLAFLQWRDGRRRRALSWWPDTLAPCARRELKLAARAGAAAPRGPSVAP